MNANHATQCPCRECDPGRYENRVTRIDAGDGEVYPVLFNPTIIGRPQPEEEEAHVHILTGG